ncbi:hypothetical protein [Bradyrhizobium sp. 141]|uniref:hypothetical protein n=1 Tax=Bradyrhizobium sp. 141 TaxID=2782617 RepID=UPI001FF91B4B|nr:hypothetical protein [Bradyrhizobium sp. 141]
MNSVTCRLQPSPIAEFAATSRAGDKYADTPRKADLAWTVLARILSFAKERGIITNNPCERGGRLYVADRRDKIWTEQDIAAVLSVASDEIRLALILAL